MRKFLDVLKYDWGSIKLAFGVMLVGAIFIVPMVAFILLVVWGH
jgi:hypothetical protein